MHRLLVLAGTAGAGFPFFLYARDYPWHLALLAAVAIGALFYSTLRTVERLRDLFRKADGDPSLLRDRDAG